MKKAFAYARKYRAHIGCAIALAAAVAFVVPVVHSAESAGRTVELDIAKFAFSPKEITITPGTRVIWTNHDEAPHTVSSNDKSFGSKGLDSDDKFEHLFDREGDFGYICTVHPFMTGVVHVRKQ
jgi:plastocyanin